MGAGASGGGGDIEERTPLMEPRAASESRGEAPLTRMAHFASSHLSSRVGWGEWLWYKLDRKDVHFTIGQRIATPYGVGPIVAETHGSYVVDLGWGTCYRNKAESNASDTLLLSMLSVSDPTHANILAPYADKYLFAGAWCALMLANWLVSKGWCALGLPNDCQTTGQWFDGPVVDGLALLFAMALVQVWLLRLDSASRFGGIFCLRRWWFHVIFFAASPVFSALGYIPGFDFSFSTGAEQQMSVASVVVLAVLGVLIVLALAWHVYFVAAHFAKVDMIAFFVSRVAIVCFYALYATLGTASTTYELHFHHYVVAFALSLFAAFDHFVSLVVLAISAGVLCQAMAAYDPALLWEARTNCAYFSTGKGTYEANNLFATVYPSTTVQAATRFCLVTQSGQPLLHTPDGTLANGVPWS